MEIEELKKPFSWEIDNFSEWKDSINLSPFSSGGCTWCLRVYRNELCGCDHLALHLHAVSYKSMRPGWKRRAFFYMVLLNQSGKVLFRSRGERTCRLFCAETPAWGVVKTLPLTKLQEKGFLENNKLTIQVYIKVVEVVHQGKSTANDIVECSGFQITASQLHSVSKIVTQHPYFAADIKPKNQGVKTAYINLLLGLIETLSKSPQSLYVSEISNAQSELTELTEAGFKLDWLKSKLEEISLEREKALSDGSWVQHLEERVKTVELALSDLKVDKIKSAQVSPFVFIDFFIKRFFLSCFSLSNH